MSRYLPSRPNRMTFWQRVGFAYRRKPKGWVVKSAEGHRFSNYGRAADHTERNDER